jgi:hypothetical protein
VGIDQGLTYAPLIVSPIALALVPSRVSPILGPDMSLWTIA